MNIPNYIFRYNDKNYIRELSDFIQESYDLSTFRNYLVKKWSHVLDIFDNYNNDTDKILLATLIILYDRGGIFINNIIKDNKIRELLSYNYFFLLNNVMGVSNVMGTFKNNPIYKDMIEYLINNKNIDNNDLFNIINNYKNSNKEEYLLIGSNASKTKEISLDKKYINPIVLFNRSNFSDNFDYLYHDNKLTIIRTDSVSDWGQPLSAIIYDDILANVEINK